MEYLILYIDPQQVHTLEGCDNHKPKVRPAERCQQGRPAERWRGHCPSLLPVGFVGENRARSRAPCSGPAATPTLPTPPSTGEETGSGACRNSVPRREAQRGVFKHLTLNRSLLEYRPRMLSQKGAGSLIAAGLVLTVGWPLLPPGRHQLWKLVVLQP